MRHSVSRRISEPIRNGLSYEERWKAEDRGLILCWEKGREIGEKNPELKCRAESGELPPLIWKGGVEKKTKKGEKFGTLYYLAQWQGLRGENLNIDWREEKEIVCSKTGMRVLFTGDIEKYGNS